MQEPNSIFAINNNANSACFGADCLGVVLAGGLSSRMGQDKAKLLRKNIDMLTFSQQLLASSGVTQVVTSGEQHQVPDVFEQAGPVGGIYSVIQKYQPKALLILPIDLPLMTADVLAKLRLTGEFSNKACCYLEHNIPLYLPNNAYLNLFFQQTFKRYRSKTSINVNINTNIKYPADTLGKDKKGPSFKALLAQVPHEQLLLKQNACLYNTNTPEQWQHAKLQLSSSY